MDVVLVTYNSEKWIDGCMNALAQTDNAKNDINIYVVDNGSSDNTGTLLRKYEKTKWFHSFHINETGENNGFGKANNIGATMGQDDIICFINVDTEVEKNTFDELKKEIAESDEKTAVWEMRQIPYEHPKLYDPVTGETSWVSGAAFAVRREVFEQVKGFDEKIFMYAEDVDLSWRIRAAGYMLKYCPKVIIHHYSYQKENEVKPVQYVESIQNNLLLRYRFGDFKTILRGHKMFWDVVFLHTPPFEGAKKLLLKKYFTHWKKAIYFLKSKVENKQVAKFLGWDYEIIREGAFLEIEFPKVCPKVSVVVRTCQRPKVLKETLISLARQTYKNFEVIVVEDGKPSAKQMVENDFPQLDIKYYYTGVNKGRSVAGNIGVQNATGEFVNFLDDDDLFFADHIETLVKGIENRKEKAVYSFAFETPIEIKSKDPYQYVVKDYVSRYKDTFNKIKLCHHNYIPIQCIMFSKELFDELGGFDTNLDYLEDWDLWVRYMQKTDYVCVEKTTSIYRVPYEKKIQKSRQDKLDAALETVREKHKGYKMTVAVSDLAMLGEESIWEIISSRLRIH